MDRSAGKRLAQAASFSVTTLFASSAAASALGSVVRTSNASVTCAAYRKQPSAARKLSLLEARQRARDRRRAAQALQRQPAHDLSASGGHDAEPGAHRQLQQPAVQLDPDLCLRVLRDDVLEEEDPEFTHVGVGLRSDGADGPRRQRELEVRVVWSAGHEAR